MNSPKYKSRIADDGNVEYVVGGVLVTRSEQEAHDLTQTGVFTLSDELTLSLLSQPVAGAVEAYKPQCPHITEAAPMGRGSLAKFPWE